MQKQAPSTGRILIAIGFALSCFLLLLYLWVVFGGSSPLSSKGPRYEAYFPEAIGLNVESDVRIGGVSVGKVKSVELAPNDPELKAQFNGQDASLASIEIDPEFAPLSTDARAILRQKTLLGETYLELTSGTEPGTTDGVALGEAVAAGSSDSDPAPLEDGAVIASLPEDGRLGPGQTQEQTQIDEIFNALDPDTRLAFQRWLQRSGAAISGRGLDLNDALGNLGPFLDDGADIVGVLQEQKAALKGVVRNTGAVFQALTENEQALHGAIVNSNTAFDALASEDRALAETFQILPTFERETRYTLQRLDEFRISTHPLVRQLLPVADDISPTLRSVRRLSPPLKNVFGDLGELNQVSRKGLPALKDFLAGLRPVMKRLDPFLANLNPVIRYLKYNKATVTDFLGGPPAGLAGTLQPLQGQPSARHQLRQISYISSESLSIQPQRLPTNRGNGYLQPLVLTGRQAAQDGIFPNFDCDNTGGGERFAGDGGSPAVGPGFAPCALAVPFPGNFGGQQYPGLLADP